MTLLQKFGCVYHQVGIGGVERLDLFRFIETLFKRALLGFVELTEQDILIDGAQEAMCVKITFVPKRSHLESYVFVCGVMLSPTVVPLLFFCWVYADEFIGS